MIIHSAKRSVFHYRISVRLNAKHAYFSVDIDLVFFRSSLLYSRCRARFNCVFCWLSKLLEVKFECIVFSFILRSRLTACSTPHHHKSGVCLSARATSTNSASHEIMISYNLLRIAITPSATATLKKYFRVAVCIPSLLSIDESIQDTFV